MEIHLVTHQILIKFLLPLILILVSVFRQNFFSFIYLLLLFASPIFPLKKISKCKPNFFLVIVILFSISIFTAQIIFNIFVFFQPDLIEKLNKCNKIWNIFNLIGLYNINNLALLNKIRLIYLDALAFLAFIIIFFFTNVISQFISNKKKNNESSTDEIQLNESVNNHEEFYNIIKFELNLNENNTVNQKKLKIWKLIQIIHFFFELFFLILLVGSAILNPSLLSLIYFLLLITLITWFCLLLNYDKIIKFFRYFICIYTFLHLSILFIYQIDVINQYLPPENFYAKILGLTQYLKFSCKTDSKLQITVLNWNIYAHPFFLIFLYFVSSYMIQFKFESSKKKFFSNKNNYELSQNKDINELNCESSIDNLEEDYDKKVLFGNETRKSNVLKLSNIKDSKSVPSSPSVFNNKQFIDFNCLSKFNLFLNLLNLIKKGNYVYTLIIMMTWSITYHSWIGFVLLIWSCIIWMTSNSRQACLQSSIFLVIYAICLLILQYVFSLNVNLPFIIYNINLSELGFTKEAYDLAYKSLLIKLFYTLSFWITLRQYMKEKKLKIKIIEEDEKTSINEDYHISLAVNFSSAEINPVLNSTINVVNKFMSNYWIIIVTLLLMLMSLSGRKVVLYRIIYMLLFLAFVLVFQISYRLWRKLMYLFWLIVIVYSMAVLVAIYTYQFKDFPDYWENYLGITDIWQKAIGLEEFKHDPLLLFYQLFTPTFFIIITIIQVHFFHNKFLQLNDLERKDSDLLLTNDLISSELNKVSSSSSNESFKKSFISEVKINIDIENENDNTYNNNKKIIEDDNLITTKKINKEYLVKEITFESPLFGFNLESIIQSILSFIKSFYELIWRFLELHLTKIIFICSMIAAIDEVNLVNFVFIILIVVGLLIKKFEKIIFHTLGIWASFLILTKMFYQLDVAYNINWKVNCSVVHGIPINQTYKPFNETIDNLNYIGFKQTKNIFGYIFKDMLIVLLLALNSVVFIRQNFFQFYLHKSKILDNNLFIGIYRKHADLNLSNCLKFLANYWFYKFGIEFIAVFLVYSIAKRRDIVAFYYSLLVFCLTILSRKKIKLIWLLLLGIHSILLPIQYLLVLGIAPGFCTDYLWSVFYLDPTLRKWFFLSDFQIPLDSSLLIYDFYLLLFITRQWNVFLCEKQIRNCENQGYFNQNNGGSNDDLKDDNYTTIDPNIKDYFLTSGKTFLDILKSFFFSCFYWITLAILFITANNRQNLFGLGYIIGCFVFLWNGNDFYLKTRNKVFKNWNYLILYTSTVIIIRTILALIGCYFAEQLFKDYCPLAKLFGIDCESKLVCIQTQPFIIIKNKSFQFLNQDCLKTSNYKNSLFWDAICLFFLLIQKRIFGSYYFNYLVIEVKAQQRLASRGAQLINEIQAKEYKEEKEEENELMEKIKAKMDLIRANQRKTLGSKIYKLKHHYQDFFDISNCETSDKEYINSKISTNISLPTIFSPTLQTETLNSPSSADLSRVGLGYLEVYPIKNQNFIYDKKFIIEKNDKKYFNKLQNKENSQETFIFQSNLDKIACLNNFFIDDDSMSSTILSNNEPNGYNKLLDEECHSIWKGTKTEPYFATTIKLACLSGDYYMVDNPDEVIDSEEKKKKSFIPDPIGDELKKFAETRGFSAFCSNFVKGNFFEDNVRLVSTENTANVDESSKDSTIVSIDRLKHKSHSSSQSIHLTNLIEDDIQPIPSTSAALSVTEINFKKQYFIEKQKAKLLTSSFSLNNQIEKEKKHQETFIFKIKKWCKIIKYFIISCLISATVKLNEVSRDYRYVSRRLAVEKKALKCIIHLKATPEAQKHLAEKISSARVPEYKCKNRKLKKAQLFSDCNDEIEKKLSLISVENDLSELADYYLDYNVLMKFIFAIYYAIISQSETFGYVCVIVNQMKNASLISLPLPFMVFLWGCLSLPKPSKTFWISLITYTEAIVVAKYMFQFKVWEWTNFYSISPTWPNISKTQDDLNSNNSLYDLFLLLVLFFHRFMLKSLGLWDLDTSLNQFEKIKFNSVDKNNFNQSNLDLKKYSKVNATLDNNKLKELNEQNQFKKQNLNNIDSSDNYEIEEKRSLKDIYFTYFLPFNNFFSQLFKLSEYRIPKDSYAIMFLCDFINFFIVVFGYSSFGSANTESLDITTYFREDRVPILFLVMLLIQFLFIIVDRALYLRKNMFGRLIFHILIVFIIHLWLFFVLPLYTQRSFATNLAPQFWYIFKTIYLILSANQIKSGYPTRILGNCFTKKYTLLNLYLFKIYMIIPFLYDLRLIMDWIWTESSLDLNEWAIMEDIFKQLFERKCEINYNDKFPYPRGEGRLRRSKFIMGGFYFMIVVIAIWFPLTLFAFRSQVGTPTKPVEVAITLEFTGYQAIFKMSSNENSLEELNKSKWISLQNKFPPTSFQFLSYYNKEDVVIARINSNSFATWDISPPNKQALHDNLIKNSTVVIKLIWKIKRKKKSQNMDVEIFNEHEVVLSSNKTYDKLRAKLVQMLENKNGSVVIPLLFPNSIRIPSKEEPKVITELKFVSSSNKSLKSEFRDINFKLNKNESSYWWTVSEIGDPYAFMNVKSNNDIILLLFNDRVFPDSLQFLSGYGIVGLYSTFVFVVSRFIRNFFDDLSFKVIYTQLPCVRKVLQLCLDIYLVRESGEFELEEDLYAKLIFLYRSPETLIKWTQNRDNLENNNSLNDGE